ncbi:MAG: hypothetical protein R3F65_28520 [bacterium]
MLVCAVRIMPSRLEVFLGARVERATSMASGHASGAASSVTRPRSRFELDEAAEQRAGRRPLPMRTRSMKRSSASAASGSSPAAARAAVASAATPEALLASPEAVSTVSCW